MSAFTTTWDPCSVPLNYRFGLQMSGECNGIETLNYDGIVLYNGFQCGSCDTITSITFPNLTTWELPASGPVWIVSENGLDIFFCNALTTIDLGNFTGPGLPFMAINFNPVLTTLHLEKMVTCIWFEIDHNATLASLDLSSFITPVVDPFDPTTIPNLSIFNNVLLTHIDFSSLFPDSGSELFLRNNALDQVTVDQVLSRCVLNPAFVTGFINMGGGTNSPPSAAGLLDKATLIGRGVTCTTN